MSRRDTSLTHTLGRLYPYARPLVPVLVAGLVAALFGTVVKLCIPRVLDAIVTHALGDPADGGPADGAALAIGVAVVAALGALEAGLISLRRRFVIAPGSTLEATLRVRLYEHLVDLPARFHDHWTGGQLLSRSVSDIRRFRRWLSFGMIMTCVNMVTLTLGITLMLLTDALLGLVYLTAAVPAFALSLRARRRYRVLSRRSMDQIGDLGTMIEESVQGIRVLKAYGRELKALEDFGDQAAELRTTEISKARQRAFISLVMTALPDSALALILVLGIVRVADGSLTPGALLAFFATATILSGPLERLSEQFAMSMEAKAAMDRYLEALHQPNPLVDPAQPAEVPAGPGRVRFAGVRYAHRGPDGAARPVLDGVDLELREGEILALVGRTGAGKSTLAQLVPRFYDVDGGSVSIDGVDVRHLRRHDLRSLVAIAFEDPVLFSATVRENVALGRPEATDDEVRAALDVAQAQFALRLPQGLDTRIGEEGLSLSGGQRQRLSLARAILARPRVLVLDDPLSALDVRTEVAVATRLREHLHATTTLLVANRPSTVHVADRIAVLDEGRVIAVGTHRELLAASPVYRDLFEGPAARRTAVPA
jgi:ATP-binding cassette subfamily B protein